MTIKAGFDPTTAHMDRIAKHLQARGFKAECMNTGGNIYCVIVEDVKPDVSLCFGASDETWGADINRTESGEHIGEIWTGVSCEERNMLTVAQAIAATVREVRQKLIMPEDGSEPGTHVCLNCGEVFYFQDYNDEDGKPLPTYGTDPQGRVLIECCLTGEFR